MDHGMLFWIIIGGIAGWLAGTLTRGGGFGVLIDIVLGIVGAFVGGLLAGVLHIAIGSGWLGALITATAGAVIILVLSRVIKRAF